MVHSRAAVSARAAAARARRSRAAASRPCSWQSWSPSSTAATWAACSAPWESRSRRPTRARAGRSSTSRSAPSSRRTASASAGCRRRHSLDDYWAEALPAQVGVSYAVPDVVSFTGSTQTGCGAATSAVGPFYCPPDQTVYIDVSFFDELRSRFGSSGGRLAEEYVIAHEFGHHIEQLSGAMESADRSGTGPESDSVRIELMADCLAGMWAGNAATNIDAKRGVPFLEEITPEQLADALSAASAVGDDRIQQSATGSVNPEAWTHGSSEQRQRWFMTGYDGGTFQDCNALEASTL
ncbi:neutral zinc metallopeptidase [Oerskovia sp. M15]